MNNLSKGGNADAILVGYHRVPSLRGSHDGALLASDLLPADLRDSDALYEIPL